MTAATIARPMPVLPEVGSTITPPGLSLPERSASSTIESAMRSLIDAPGLTRSCLIQTSARSPNSRLMRTCGVLPMVSRMLAAFMPQGLLQWARGKSAGRARFASRQAPPATTVASSGGGSSGRSNVRARRSSGNHSAHSKVTATAAIPPVDGRGDRAEPRGGESAARLAELVGGRDRQRRRGGHPAAHLVGRMQLDQRLADIDREHVRRAKQGEHRDRQAVAP